MAPHQASSAEIEGWKPSISSEWDDTQFSIAKTISLDVERRCFLAKNEILSFVSWSMTSAMRGFFAGIKAQRCRTKPYLKSARVQHPPHTEP